MPVNEAISQIQRLLNESEEHVKDARECLRRATRAQTALHEAAAKLLETYGDAIGAEPDVVASIVTPKNPPK